MKMIRICTALLLIMLAVPRASVAGDSVSRVHVFILGVGEFKRSDIYHPLPDVTERIKDLHDYFRDTYGLAESQIQIFSKEKNNITEATLRDFPELIASTTKESNSVVFVFVLTHGKLLNSKEDGQDLAIVAYDTPGDVSDAEPKRLLGSAILRALARMGENSIAFAFFDTCNSGVLSTFEVKLNGALDFLGTRLVALASSGPDDDSYDFSFTRELVDWWRRPPPTQCKSANDIPSLITLREQKIEPIFSDNELCINAVSSKKAMLFLLPDQLHPGTAILELRNSENGAFAEDQERIVKSTDHRPLLLMSPRGTVRLKYVNKEHEPQWTGPGFDLEQTPFAFADLSNAGRPYTPSESLSGAQKFGMQSVITPQ